MATAKFIEQAKRPIYKRGKKVEYISQRGKHAGETKTKIDRNQPADEQDEILINVGEGYWTWCFYGGSPIYSKVCIFNEICPCHPIGIQFLCGDCGCAQLVKRKRKYCC